MRLRIGSALIALAVATPMALMPSGARAAVDITIDPGSVAFGYSDGYWDREHQWHAWPSKADADWYREHYREHYYARRHEEEKDKGWNDSERWWDRH